MPDFTRILERIVPRLDDLGVRYALIGGLAVSAHGCIRDTHDIDFLVREPDLEAFDKAAIEVGYQLTERLGTMSFFELFGAGLAPMDVLHAARPSTLEMLERADRVPIGKRGVQVKIVQVEDLIGLKVYAIDNNPKRRSKDWNDIVMLADRFRDRLDWNRVRSYFSLFGREGELETLRREVHGD
ncbi:MAG: nucleotidyltransferase [Planctomycetes bacterium]|nr:nucleotidyltransferase [Planctomycetota bacterium]